MNVFAIRARVVLHALRSSSSCQRGCCWTPWGHSGAAVECHCHDFDEFTVLALIRQQLLDDARRFGATRSKYLTAEDAA